LLSQASRPRAAWLLSSDIAAPFKAWVNGIKGKDLVKKVWLKPVSNHPFHSST
jgi:hypothetical protein